MARLARRPAAIRVALALLLAAAPLGSCAAPTEIRLHVRTNVPCTDPTQWSGVAVYAGRADSSLEDRAPVLTTRECDEHGQIGSLVVVPSGAKDEEVGLRLVAGLTYSPEDCAAHHYQGCIVARRAVRFNPRAALDLDIDLNGDCRGIACDTAHTCVAGTCTDVRTAAPVTPADTPQTVRCGDNGVVCPTTGNVCCLTLDPSSSTTTGDCRPARTCPATSLVLFCDDQTDCTAFGTDPEHPGLCMLDYSHPELELFTPTRVFGSQCQQYAGTGNLPNFGLQLCEERSACLAGTSLCTASPSPGPLPHYFYCLVHV